MRLLVITLEYPPFKGGIANYIKNEVDQFRAAGEDVWVAAEPLGEKEQEVEHDENLIRVPFFFKWIFPRWLRIFWYLWKDLKSGSYDYLVIHHVLPIGQVAWLIKKFKKIPYVLHIHGLDVSLAKRSWYKRRWLKKVIENAEFVVGNSKFASRTADGFPIKKLVIAYPGPNAKLRDTKVSEDTLNNMRQQYVLGNRKVLLSVARLVKRKGLQAVAEVLPEIIKEDPEIVWVVVGVGDYADELAKVIGKHDIQYATRFVGEIDDEALAAWFTLCDVFVMPSIQIGADVEGWGIVYLEAALFGKPVIAGNAGGAPEAVQDAVTGYVVDGNKPDEVKDVIMKLMKDENLRKKMGTAGKARVEKEFMWKEQIGKILKVLHNPDEPGEDRSRIYTSPISGGKPRQKR